MFHVGKSYSCYCTCYWIPTNYCTYQRICSNCYIFKKMSVVVSVLVLTREKGMDNGQFLKYLAFSRFIRSVLGLQELVLRQSTFSSVFIIKVFFFFTLVIMCIAIVLAD